MAFNVARAGEHAYHIAQGGQRPNRNQQPDEEAEDDAARAPPFRKQTSHYELDFNEQLNEQHIKEGFTKKVYAILGVQMAFTTFVAGSMMFHPSLGMVGVWFLQHSFLMLIPMVCTICCLQVHKDKFPMNLFLLFALTFLISLNVGGICFMRYSIGQGQIILTAVATTAIIFFTLTAVVWTVGDKFGWMGNFLFVALVANMIFSIFAFISGWSAMYTLYNIFGVFIFTGYIMYDTNQIVNKVRLEDADMGNAIVGAVELYLDIVNLFLHLLSLLGRGDN